MGVDAQIMRIFGLKNCDTCRKAAKVLTQAELVDIRATPIDDELLSQALKTFGDRLVNTRSTTWRGLNETERSQDPLSLLMAHPALMKRPLIVDDAGHLYLGWDKTTQAALGVG